MLMTILVIRCHKLGHSMHHRDPGMYQLLTGAVSRDPWQIET
jgi:hypothetical protein